MNGAYGVGLAAFDRLGEMLINGFFVSACISACALGVLAVPLDRAELESRMSNEVAFILLMLPIALGVIIIGGAIIVSH